jgi:hypothetical protein
MDNEPEAILSPADRAALRKYYAIEIEGHCAGVARRELHEDLLDISTQITVAEQRLAYVTETKPRLENPSAYLIDAQRRAIERLQVRADVIRPELERITARAQSLWSTRDNLKRVLEDEGLLIREVHNG